MKALSPGRIEAISLAIVDTMERSPTLEILDRGKAVRAISHHLTSVFGDQGDDVDRAARARIASLSRNVPEGSREWDVLYRQYSEEIKRRG